MKIYEHTSEKLELFNKVMDIVLPDINKERILIFDIDTTAFEPANGCVFLIGTEYFDGNELHIKQYFSEDIGEEATVINAFLAFAADYDVLLNYKANSFDIPFLAGRLQKPENKKNEISYHNLNHVRHISYDLFDEVRPLKTGLGIASTKIDTLRKLTGQSVTERITGENISKFYVQYISEIKLRALHDSICSSHKDDLIKDYSPRPVFDDLAHIKLNEDDSFLTDVLSRNRDNMESVLYISRLAHLFNMSKGKYDCSILKSDDNVTISIDSQFEFTLNIIEKDLKMFFINYRDYFYFPAEDMAMHKSVAEFADKDSRKKATAQTAYNKVSGSFVKIPASYIKAKNQKEGCFYKENFESENYYLPVNDILNMNENDRKILSYQIALTTPISNFLI